VKKQEHHSARSARQSELYHAKLASTMINPNPVGRSSTKMTKLEPKKQSLEDMDEKGHKL